MYGNVTMLRIALVVLLVVGLSRQQTVVMITQPASGQVLLVNSSAEFVCTVNRPDKSGVTVKWYVLPSTSDTGTATEVDSSSQRYEASERMLSSLVTTRVFVLTVRRVEYVDDGKWTCLVESRNGTTHSNSTYVTVNGKPIIVVDKDLRVQGQVDQNLTMDCVVLARPQPSSWGWYDPSGRKIQPVGRYAINITTDARNLRRTFTLTLRDFQPTDAGNYTCAAGNGLGEDRHVFLVSVFPYVTITNPTTDRVTISRNDRAEATCHARNFGTEQVHVKWWFKQTPTSDEVLLDDDLDAAEGKIETALKQAATLEYVTETRLTLYQTQFKHQGEYICRVTLFTLHFSDSLFVNVQGEPQVSLPLTLEVDEGEDVRVECIIAAIPVVNRVRWYVNGDLIPRNSTSRFIITNNFGSNLHSVSQLDIYNIQRVEIDATEVTCEARNSIGTSEASTRLVAPVRCVVGASQCGPNEECVKRTTMYACQCRANFHRNNNGVCEDDNECELPGICEQVCVNEVGTFHCQCYPNYVLAPDQRACLYQVPNTITSDTTDPTPSSRPQTNTIGIVIGVIVAVVVVIVVVVAGLFLYFRRRGGGHKGRSKPRKDGVYNASFHNSPDDNSILSPNDKRYRKRPLPPIQYHVYTEITATDGEFPRNRLKLLEPLGEGKFGRVLKAEALDILRRGKWDLVAVKMVKEAATDVEKDDFFHELMINRSIPQHANVVSFLGAVTSSDPVMMILEYVDGDNLLSFLRSRRHPPGFRQGDITEANDLTSRDLFSFALQSARGMAHLAQHKIIHRDVAARNVLLEGHSCKISDFGLSRNVAGSDVYERTSRGPLPIRWMAPECFRDNLHATESDVWAFGVLLWEIVTLGASPYPGFSAAQVMTAVLDGQRLERPPHCAQELYDIMSQCWMEAPGARPAFPALVRTFETLLEREGEYLQLDDLDEAIYCVLEPSASEERV